jgi:competence protein ComEC
MSIVAAVSRPPEIGRRLVSAVHQGLLEITSERDRWILWAPVLVGLGVAFYFSLPSEPPAWVGPVLAAGAAVCATASRAAGGDRWVWLWPTAAGVFAVAIGFAAAQIKAAAVGTEMLSERLGPTLVSGRVDRVESFPDGQRVTLHRPTISPLSGSRSLEMARIRLRGAQPAIRPGDRIRVRAVLAPPPPPAAPGAYDFQRQAYFDGLGAVGYSVGSATVLIQESQNIDVGLWFARLRTIVGERIRAHLDGATAAVTTALLNGEQRAIPDRIMAAIRDSGLAHLLSISGLHIGMVAAIVLFAVRGGLALVPPIALRLPIKKWAAVASVFAAGAYTLLAAAPVPSQRSFLMIAVVLLAMLVDRQGISMRLLAFAALVVLITQPEAVLGPSFQMSFAAVLALMSAYEFMRERRRAPDERAPASRRALVYLAGVILSTLIAGTATAPFGVYHFNRFQVYGIAANMIAVPVTGFWIMPWAIIAFLLMPFGLEGLALAPLSWGVDVVIWAAVQVASWPGAVVLLPAMPIWSLGLISLGGIWLCIWRGRHRWLGLGGILCGLLGVLTVENPDLLVDGSGRLLATKAADGGLLISSKSVGRSTREAWLRRVGSEAPTGYWPKQGASADGRLRCDTLGCVYRASNHVVAVALRGEALLDDCRLADVVVSLAPVRSPCASARTLIDRFDLWREGAHAIWLNDRQVRVESVAAARGDRPWVIRPPRAMSYGDEEDAGAVREATADAPAGDTQ